MNKYEEVRICCEVYRKARYSDSRQYRVLDAHHLGYWTPFRYVVQYLWSNEIGQEIWMCCRHGALIGTNTWSSAYSLMLDCEAKGVQS